MAIVTATPPNASEARNLSAGKAQEVISCGPRVSEALRSAPAIIKSARTTPKMKRLYSRLSLLLAFALGGAMARRPVGRVAKRLLRAGEVGPILGVWHRPS